MRTKFLVSTLALSAALVAFNGCKKEESDTQKAGEETKQATSSMTEGVKEAADKTAEEAKKAGETVKAEAEKAVTQAKEEAKSTAGAVKDKAQTIIDQAKALVGDGKHQDALKSLEGLASFKLTGEQQKTVNDLKAQIQKALSSQAVGNLLEGKK